MDNGGLDETLLDTLPDLLFVFTENGTLERWNEAVPEVTGYSEAALAEMTPADFLDGEDRDRMMAATAELLETGPATVEAKLVTATGEHLPYEFNVRKLPDENPRAFVGIGRDITARKAAEEERETILDRMRDGFFAVDTDWRVTYVNGKGEQLLARAMDRPRNKTTFEGLHLWEEIPDAVDTTFYEKYHDALRTGEPVTFEEYFTPLDEWFEVRVFPDKEGLSIYFREITEQRSHRKQLERRETVLKEMHAITADRDITFTEQVQQLLALARDELGTEYGSFSKIVGDDYVFEVVDATDDSIQAGDVVPLEATNCELVASRSETIAWGDISREAPEETDRAGYTEWGISCYLGAPVYDNDGVYGTFCFYGTDTRPDQFSEWEVTLVDLMSRWISYELQRKQATEQLQRQNRRLEQFASVISHDLRSPLSVILGRLELAEEAGNPEDFAACYDAVERMETLIDDLLALSKAGAAIDETELVALGDVVDAAWGAVPTADATLRRTTEATVRADPSRMQQLFENLFRNAIEHGGEDVTVKVGTLDDGFYIEDDGPGIPESDRDDAFESGYTTKPDGTGFGLAIVADIVDAHGWEIDVTDGETGGACFSITGIDTM